jgi:hypothetical protein
MKYYLKTIAAVAVTVAAAAPAFAGSQLAANAGISPVEAQGLSLTEIAQAKFNRDTRQDDRHVFVEPGTGGDYTQLAASAGISADEAQGMSLGEIYVAKINRESRGDEQQAVKGGGVTMTSRSVSGGAGYAQLAASAGLSADEASGLTLGQIAAAKFARDTYSSDN